MFCDLCRMQRWLDVEAALALSQGELGLIPDGAAQAIAHTARLEQLDVDQIAEEIRQTRHSLVPLLTALQQACPGTAGEYIHFGATTQDIKDTAAVLEIRAVLEELGPELQAIVRALTGLAEDHRDSLMVARTHARAALPTTFGLKVAGWLDELLRHVDRITALRPRVLVVQLFGGVGTLAGFGEKGPDLVAAFARRLSLAAPSIGWHVARDRIAEYVTTVAMLAATSARIAEEIRFLSRPEIGELEEGWQHGRIGSSTMPHKRNPEALEQVTALSRLVCATVPLALDTMVQEHERDGRGTRFEWVAIADSSHHTLAAVSVLRQVLDGLRVHTARMATHAEENADLICSEALMLTLGRHVGKQSAHAAVYEASQRAQDANLSLRECLSDEVSAQLPPEELDAAFDPAQHTGAAGTLVDGTVAASRQWLADAESRRALPPIGSVPAATSSREMSFLASPDEVTDWRMVLVYDAAVKAGALSALPGTAPQIADSCGLDPDAVRVVLDLLALWDVVRRNDEGAYTLSPTAPDAEVDAIHRHHARSLRLWASEIDNRLHGRKPTDAKRRSPDERELWYRGLAARGRPAAPAVIDACLRRFPTASRVLDLGGGHGEHALEFKRRGLAVTLQDRPDTIELARRSGRLQEAGVQLYPGDFFDTLPQGPFDIVFCAAVTDTFDGACNAALYQRLRPTVAEGGGLALLAFLRRRNQAVPAFAVQMLMVGNGGDTHAEDEYRRWLAEAGFSTVEVDDIAGLPQSLVTASRGDGRLQGADQ